MRHEKYYFKNWNLLKTLVVFLLKINEKSKNKIQIIIFLKEITFLLQKTAASPLQQQATIIATGSSN